MLNWKIKNRVISELYYKDQNIIYPWGFETADSSAFFSLEKGFGYRYSLEKEIMDTTSFEMKLNLISKMKEGKWDLTIHDKIQDNSVIRNAHLKTLENSYFMDFVMRFRFKKEYFNYAMINDTIYYHNDTNIYYQFPVNYAELIGNDFSIRISVLDSIVPENMEPTIYVRDANDQWVIHVRMVPKKWHKEVIKICTAWAGTRPLPQWISSFILQRPTLRELLWYRGEKKPFKNRWVRKFLNPAAFGMTLIPKNTEFMWNVKMEIR